MDSEYEQKFEEMKSYIPFLENMIKRLESSGLSSNPRQAQLDKIRSLRDLLLDKKKRMKMENLLKCEQVLINLYAKVEQRPNLDGDKISSEKDKTDLNAVRNKLKSIVKSKLNLQDGTETLPEIAMASKTEEECVSGSKEPALFQRRPNKGTEFTSPHKNSVSTVHETSHQPSKRNYTRVLHSPETDERCWSSSEGTSDLHLFSRRSPRRSTPSYNKRERKKSKQKGKQDKMEDFNITLKVPVESLSSLNTENILSRIINCSDSDVDISTLRELRSQILGELKHTGSNDDISDLILRSYKKNIKDNKESDEMEDGELSDSECENIKNVYSSIVVLDKDKNTMNLVGKTSDNEAPRQIKICLVINKDQISSKISTENSDQSNATKFDLTDLNNCQNDKRHNMDLYKSEQSHSHNITGQSKTDFKKCDESVSTEINAVGKCVVEDSNLTPKTTADQTKTTKAYTVSSPQLYDTMKEKVNEMDHLKSAKENIKDNVTSMSKSSSIIEIETEIETNAQIKPTDIGFDKKVNILNLEETADKEVASEIDILQALKQELLSETSTALSADVDTPPLHQPKITKVVNTLEIGSKKRISIENYKAKSINPTQSNSFLKVDSTSKEELSKKQSLKLTDKECERFNFLSKMTLHDSSDDEDNTLSFDDIYDNLAPKSPDHENIADAGLTPPIIIPSDPVNKVLAATESDIDMRNMVSVPNSASFNGGITNSSSVCIDSSFDYSKGGKEFYTEGKKENNISLTDPRIKRDMKSQTGVTNRDTDDPVLLNQNISRQLSSFGGSITPQSNSTHFLAPNVPALLPPNISPALVPNMSLVTAPIISPAIAQNIALGMPLNMPPSLTQPLTSNVMGNMTPNARTYEMTPRLCIDNEDFTVDRHIYTPTFSSFDVFESENSIERHGTRWNKTVWDDGRNLEKRNPPWNDAGRLQKQENRIPVWEAKPENDNGKNDEKRVWEDPDIRNNFVNKRYQGSKVDMYKQGYNDRHRYDIHDSYSKHEPECPRTPIHSFGRQECPSTPTPSFGRSDMPMTPVHPFGRSDFVHRTSTNQYGVNLDPRRSRGSDYKNRDEDRERRYSHSYRSNQSNQPRNTSDYSRQYHREQSDGRYDRKDPRRLQYRESDDDFKSDKFYSNRRNKTEYDYKNKNNSDSYQRGYRDYGIEKSNSGRSPSVRSNFGDSDNSENNLISIQSNTGKSFTVDVSINKTFQIHESNIINDNFDARRQRAASVGRTLHPENIERKFEHDEKNTADSVQSKKDNFRRASSVGREVAKMTKDLKDVKEDLKSFKLKSDPNEKEGYCKSFVQSSSHDLYMRKDEIESRKITSTPYSPKKNTRDVKRRERNQDRRNQFRNSKNYGIVYSNDNISKGTILGSGYGVKNYKIPKIKRISMDKEISEVIERTKESSSKDVIIGDSSLNDSDNSFKSMNKADKKLYGTSKVTDYTAVEQEAKVDSKKDSKDISARVEDIFLKSDSCENNAKEDTHANTLSESASDNVEKRVTRSAKKKLSIASKHLIESSSFTKTRKVNKSYFSDSDSDETSTPSEKQNDKSTEEATEVLIVKTKDADQMEEVFDECKIKTNSTEEKNKLDIKDSNKKDSDSIVRKPCLNFSVIDIETFQENLISDPVVKNINELIADLDQDLDVDESKSIYNKVDENLESLDKVATNEVSKRNPITSTVFNYDSQNTVIPELETSSANLTNNTLRESESVALLESANTDCEEKCKETPQLITEINRTDDLTDKNFTAIMDNATKSYDEQYINNDVADSTTEKSVTARQTNNYATVPDSTFNVNEGSSDVINRQILPDSTGESENIMNPATEISTNYITENQESSKTKVSNEINSLLSLLQDKSKIKELISKLASDTSDNDKIKKTLEKLSEIVLDDEENTEDDHNNGKTNETLDTKSSDNNEKIDENNAHIKIQSAVDDINILRAKKADDIILNMDKSCDNLNVPVISMDNTPIETRDRDDEGNEKVNEILDNVQKMDEYLLQNTKQSESDEKTLKGNSLIDELEKPCDNVDVQLKEDNICVQDRQDFKPAIKVKPKNKKYIKKGRRKYKKKGNVVKNLETVKKEQPKVKKPSRELKNLQDDMREIFIKDDVLSVTGIRMCRLLKLEKNNQKVEKQTSDNKPVVALKKINNVAVDSEDKAKKDKLKENDVSVEANFNSASESKINKQPLSNRPGPKSKTRPKIIEDEVDPYIFETDLVNECNDSESLHESSSESENESISSQIIESSEKSTTERQKKIKRKRQRGWQDGIIRPKNRKKDSKSENFSKNSLCKDNVKIPDLQCFTDKLYCFKPNTLTYSCRLCVYTGSDIVLHYINNHPHSEIPLSRLCPDTATEAIKQCEEVNFQAISKMPSNKYTCRFCFKEIVKKTLILEEFFWHIVSMHTGEYIQQCSECVDSTKCPFNIDIPPPPEYTKGQLLGYICGKCNFTQVSLENLKTHVINRHNDEQTEVYTINLSVLSKKAINNYLKQLESQNSNLYTEEPRKLRSTRSTQNIVEYSDDESSTNGSSTISEPIPSIQSKIIDDGDDLDEITSRNKSIKIEPVQETNKDDSLSVNITSTEDDINTSINETENIINQHTQLESTISSDIFAYPHFKVTSASGIKEYVCCINGNDYHYKTTLLISMKKHVTKNHLENWDGYCFLCKVIVTPQGTHRFKECLNHYLDKHIDDFPILDNIAVDCEQGVDNTPELNKEIVAEYNNPDKTFSIIKPFSQVTSTVNESHQSSETNSGLPIIKSVISLGMIKQPLPSPNYPKPENTEAVVEYKYEEAQADIMSKKHRVVLEAMINNVNLIQIFKCAGKFCSFTTDSAEEALLHASTHERIGGEHALCCVYCDFDASGNAIDLVTHVFKNHGCCPYVCGICFYRAAASQLVQAHINRVHPDSNALVLGSTVVTTTVDEDVCLPRKTAVPPFLCTVDSNTPKPCKFRTYTPGKFSEHALLRHQNTKEFLCFVCAEASPTVSELLRHFRTHGFKLYQCAWCVFGADNEQELLEHASAKHPCKQPKAFLRIIINKEGSTEYKVLPMVHLNKDDITVHEISPNVCVKYPVKEAERAVELEKLIGETSSMIESMSTDSTDSNTVTPSPIISGETGQDMTVSLPSRVTSTASGVESHTNTLKAERSVVTRVDKIDTTNLPNVNVNNVVYLDSDDENAASNVIDLSADTSEQIKTLDITKLFACSRCGLILRTGLGLKRHMKFCYGSTNPKTILCAHCTMSFEMNELISHYMKIHLKSKPSFKNGFICPICNLELETINLANEHFKAIHSQNYSKIIWKPQPIKPDVKVESLSKSIKEIRLKRKRSLGIKDKTMEPPEKIKKFGPEDIDKLPINPILDDFVYCSLCEFSTKVKLNMVRHLQQHAQQQPVPETAPVNPVPHLETNEKHFDKMLNLASSSIVNRPPDKINRSDTPSATPSGTQRIAPEDAIRFPKYVPDRQRHTCGAKGCSYISVDQSMLKCHWETLHSSSNDFHCVHCPPHQHLDSSKPLTASRILGHLKMHDVNLYACSLCMYYHNKRQVLEKHLHEIHKGGEVLIVRDESTISMPNTSQAAPTMDLKAWHCGSCEFKSLLRPEVVEHCAKFHNSKMQYKCAYCAFRTSNLENIPKHQSKSHSGKQEEIFYYYYREGSIPDEADGTARWLKQRRKMEASGSQVKTEAVDNSCPSIPPVVLPAPVKVDLTLVKKEIADVDEETVSELRREYGEFCEPNGLKYKCPLCNNVSEDKEEAMQSHLYEELKYRKWGCSICFYKAFHKAGFIEHIQTEHVHNQNVEPLELPVNNRIETWITKLLEHQKSIIEKNKETLAIQKAEIKRVIINPSLVSESQKLTNVPNVTTPVLKPELKPTKELEKIFGAYGKPSGSLYCCPKCSVTFSEEDDMRTHLENELHKIRWYCSNCSQTFQTYHEAQFHCKSAHVGLSSRPVEATRDASLRSNWVESAMQSQRKTFINDKISKVLSSTIQETTTSKQNENSLLVVRFEQQVTTPEEEMARMCSIPKGSDDEQLDIENTKQDAVKRCPYCSYITTHTKLLNSHVLKHYGLKACSCPYCGFDGNRKQVMKHQRTCHPLESISVIDTEIPREFPVEFLKKQSDNSIINICLDCRKPLPPSEVKNHCHDKRPPNYGQEGDIVVKCCICSMLHKEVSLSFNHHNLCHPQQQVDYVFCKLSTEDDQHNCVECNEKFTSSQELSDHILKHHTQNINDIAGTSKDVSISETSGLKRKSTDDSILKQRKVARKSTCKQSKSFAKKSTTKLPFNTPKEDNESSQSSEDLDKPILIPFCNTMKPFTLRKLPEIFGNVVVNVEKLND